MELNNFTSIFNRVTTILNEVFTIYPYRIKSAKVNEDNNLDILVQYEIEGAGVTFYNQRYIMFPTWLLNKDAEENQIIEYIRETWKELKML